MRRASFVDDRGAQGALFLDRICDRRDGDPRERDSNRREPVDRTSSVASSSSSQSNKIPFLYILLIWQSPVSSLSDWAGSEQHPQARLNA